MNFYEELLEAKKENDTVPQATAPGLLNAVVKEIWDEKHKGMVRVEYLLGEKDHKTSDWVRVMTPYGGKEYGNYWLPEINTEVIVGFIQGNLNMPVVLGCVWNETDPQPKEIVNKENDTKTILTKAGNKITFSDKKGKEKIQIETPKHLEVMVDDEKESIVLQDKEGKNCVELDCKGGNVTVTAKTTVKLQVGDKEVLKADSNSVKLTAGTVQLDASQSLKLKGQTAEMSGTSVKVKANGELGLQASGVAQVKGSMVKIN
ncbi:MAG: hypothetical protein HFH24_02200 [Ruminococcus sp.]|nr:hypothetical protein [Ruminococcus sp.]